MVSSFSWHTLRDKKNLWRAVTLEVIVLLTGATFFLPIGGDLADYYLPFARGCLSCGHNPYYASWLLWPLGLLPDRVAWSFWTFASCLGIWWACERLGTNPIAVLLSSFGISQLRLGQIDAVLAVGLVLAMTANNPIERGLGLVLASIKPQVAGIAIVTLLWYERANWRVLVAPGLVLAASLAIFGFDWPLQWLISGYKPQTLQVMYLSSLFPIGLISFLSVLKLKGKRDQVHGVLLASALGMPFYSAYSYVVPAVFGMPWWATVLSYVGLITYPWLWWSGLFRFLWLVPASLLICLLWFKKAKVVEDKL